MRSCARRYNADAAEKLTDKHGAPGKHCRVSPGVEPHPRYAFPNDRVSYLSLLSEIGSLSLPLSLRLSVSPHGDGARPSENLRRSAHARQIIPPYARFLLSEL